MAILGTNLARSLGTTLGTGDAAITPFQQVLAAKGIYAYEARRSNLSGGNVASFIDLIDGSLAPVTGTLAAPAADATLAGALSVTLNGAGTAASVKPESAFRALHNGTALETRSVYVPVSGVPIVISNRAAGAGYSEFWLSSSASVYIANATTALYNPTRSAAAGSALQSRARYTGGSYFWKTSGQAEISASPGGAHATGASDQTLTIGAVSGAGVCRWFGSYGFLPLTAPEAAIVDAYLLAQTGTAP